MEWAENARFLPNPHSDGAPVEYAAEAALSAAMALVPDIERCVAKGKVPCSDGSARSDRSIYTGLCGLTIGFLRLGTATRQQQPLRRAREVALACVKAELVQRDSPVSFFCGAPGGIAVACAASGLLGDDAERTSLLRQLLDYADAACAHQDDELLFGRAGYIYAVLFATRGGAPRAVAADVDATLRRVAERIIANGKAMGAAAKPPWPLLWHCFGEPYLGAAHGTIGVLAMLWRCHHCLPAESRLLVRETTARLLQIRHASTGNPPIALGDKKDVHVHWCHGSPGLPAMIVAAIEADGDSADGALRAAALRAGEDVWRRGVLLKGNGLCHGLAGNGYAFLSLYRLTGEQVHLDRARAFASLLEDARVQGQMAQHEDPQRRVLGQPDSPGSLMEGSVGVLCFLLDLAAPEAAAFPGWEL